MDFNLSPNFSGSILNLKSSLHLHQCQPPSGCQQSKVKVKSCHALRFGFTIRSHKGDRKWERERIQSAHRESMRGQQSQGQGTSRPSSQWEGHDQVLDIPPSLQMPPTASHARLPPTLHPRMWCVSMSEISCLPSVAQGQSFTSLSLCSLLCING